MSARTVQAGKAIIVVDILDRTKASFNKLASGLMKGSRALRDMGTNAAGATLLTGLAAKSVMGTYIKFEDQMLNLSAKLGMFGVVTAKQEMILKGLESTIINLGKQTSYTSAEVADAAISLAQAGFSADAITSSLQSVLDLARGTGYALGDSADLLANAIKTFNIFGANDSVELRMQKINQVASQFVKATRLGTIEIEDLRESLKYASGSAHNLGVELPVLLGFLVQMSESGLKASLAGTSLNTALLNMIKNSEKLQSLDPSFAPTTDAGGNMDMAKTFSDIMKMTSKLSKMKKVEVFGDIFNIRGARMVSSVQEMEQVESFIKQISLAGEEARLAAAKMESGVGGSVRRATSAWEALEIAMGRVFKNEAMALGNFTTLIIDNFESIIRKNKKLVAAFLLSPIAFGAIAIGALSLSFILARLTTVVSSLAYAFKGLKSVGGIMAGGAKSLASPIAAMAKTRSIKAAAIKSQAAKVAKLQLAVDIMYAKAGAKKTVAAQQAAIAKVAASKKVASLATATGSLQKMRAGTIGGKLASAKGVGSAVASKASLISQTVAEKSFYTKRAAMYNKYAAFMLKRLQYYSTLGKIIQRRGVGDPRAAFASAAKARAARAGSLAKAGRATGLAKGASITKALMSGASFAKMFAGIGKGISGIAQLAFSFGRLSLSLTRFVFSWNFVGLALNALLLFGHKIPAVKKAFDDVGLGISRAFGQIGNIATYAAPSLKLFSLAFDAFVSGDTQTGVEAISTAFSSLVSIIQNQLFAAWKAFTFSIADTWTELKKLGSAFMVVFSSIIEAVGHLFGNQIGHITKEVSKIFEGSEGNTFMSWIATIALTLNNFITEFAKAIIQLQDWSASFVSKITDLATGKTTKHAVANSFSTTRANNFLKGEGVDTSTYDWSKYDPKKHNQKMFGFNEKENTSDYDYLQTGQNQQNPRLAELENDRLKREKELLKTFGTLSRDTKKKDNNSIIGANRDSQRESNRMSITSETLAKQFAETMAARQAELQKQMNAQGSIGVKVPGQAQIMQTFGTKLEALIGSVGETRARFKVTSEKTMEEISKDQLQELRGLRSDIKTVGAF